ncbi:histidine kinase dimerization/phosphoacceptor domain-containing protein [Streptomyces sp. NBC_01788]|uniref:histidine kinase dimerization/phosphoacceptor domain-containing protein n=1 Tax=Streptomyces sp. NBC_01788 TaxID=2975940 RepID=UPI002DDB8986|nr:histidine kinase dimerization/phosphoacceptor domain-containing protein [Streptomyces sp. NBC_01788]WSB29955.1 histidine kinase dimerization/phosphoacceptor domain-containing protein [Streptomyces sp. NBC_01788]
MPGLLSPLTRAVTYTRWLHVLVGAILPIVCALVYPGLVKPTPADWALIAVLPVPLILAAAMVPSMRRAEGLQARLMLFPGPHARVRSEEDPGVSAAPSASWSDRARTGAWMVLRMEAGLALGLVSDQLLALSLSLAGAAAGSPGVTDSLLTLPGSHWWYALLVPVPVLVLLAVAAVAGALMAQAARRLLGPSVRERLSELEQRTERLLERNRIAQELHDSLGHALTLAVVQAGAARAAADPEFTGRALEAIEEAGRAALEDLEQVLFMLRDTGRPAGPRPALGEADRLNWAPATAPRRSSRRTSPGSSRRAEAEDELVARGGAPPAARHAGPRTGETRWCVQQRQGSVPKPSATTSLSLRAPW